MKIRRAGPADHGGWLVLRRQLWPECPLERHQREIEESGRAAGVVLLAEAPTSELVGLAEVSVRREHVEGSTALPVPYLEGWIVAEPWRRRGVGRLLMGAVVSWAREQGFKELASDAELGNFAAISAHRELGFREVGRSIRFLRSLEGEEEL